MHRRTFCPDQVHCAAAAHQRNHTPSICNNFRILCDPFFIVDKLWKTRTLLFALFSAAKLILFNIFSTSFQHFFHCIKVFHTIGQGFPHFFHNPIVSFPQFIHRVFHNYGTLQLSYERSFIRLPIAITLQHIAML